MTAGITVTAVRDDAAAELAAIDAAAFEVPWSEPAFQGLLRDGLTRAWLARDASGAALGAALLRVAAGEGELLRIAVRPEARRRGVARGVLQAVLSAAADMCPHGVHLEVRASNVAARHLYAREGFVDHGRRRDYYQAPREDAVLMHWRPATPPAGRLPGL
jgi:ribosomal-protein-alanine N-acetyltransferase